MLDTVYSIETPEGIDLSLRPAGPLPRILAYTIDLLIRWTLMLILGIVFNLIGKLGMGIMLIVYFLLEWFYPVYFEVFHQGITPGKKTFELRVVNDDGSPVGWGGAMVRNLLRAADFLPFAYISGLICMVCSAHFRRLGDLAAGTLVVHDHKLKARAKNQESGSCPAPVPLTAEEQRALMDFSESRGRLSPQRQAELANILSPLTRERDAQGVSTLLKIANDLMGRG